jgi:hypothetical protein
MTWSASADAAELTEQAKEVRCAACAVGVCVVQGGVVCACVHVWWVGVRVRPRVCLLWAPTADGAAGAGSASRGRVCGARAQVWSRGGVACAPQRHTLFA